MNVPQSFRRTYVLETEPSDFHLMTLTVMRQKVYSLGASDDLPNPYFTKGLFASVGKPDKMHQKNGDQL